MINSFSILLGKAIILLSNVSKLGSGSTWPGHIALKLNPNFNRDILKKSNTKIIVIAGTNGKTTTARLITSIIRENDKSYLQNKAGANLVNGLASTLIRGAGFSGKLNKDYLIFESDENALPTIVKQTNPDYIVCLDLFRDQLDRYGEVDSIARIWKSSFEKLTNKTRLLLNADDPQIAFLAEETSAKVSFFGLDKSGRSAEITHGADSIYCPRCSEKLKFSDVHFSHLGIWDCPSCGLKRHKSGAPPLKKYPLLGTYNKYNALAASLFAKLEKFKEGSVEKAFESFTPAFGRQEQISYMGKGIKLFLSKNPTSFNESLTTIKEAGGKNILILLNDRIPDGRDVSWIWDINFEDILPQGVNIGVSGDRVYDMALRLKYGAFFAHHSENPKTMLDKMVENLEEDETLYILPNYSAMLDIRKTLTGRGIL